MPFRERVQGYWPLQAIYFLHILVGGLAIFRLPPSALSASSSVPIYYTWGAFLFLGGISCTYCSLRGRWFGELIGLPLLIAADLVYAVSLYNRWLEGELRAPYVAILILALPVVLFSRFRIKLHLFQLMERTGNRE